MRVYQSVRGTMENVPQIEVNVDTVYVRSNIERIETDDFEGWQYDEVQYDKNKYIEKLTNTEDTDFMAMLISVLISEVDFLSNRVTELEGGMK